MNSKTLHTGLLRHKRKCCCTYESYAQRHGGWIQSCQDRWSFQNSRAVKAAELSWQMTLGMESDSIENADGI